MPVDSAFVIHIIDPVFKGKAILDHMTRHAVIRAVFRFIYIWILAFFGWWKLDSISCHEGAEDVLKGFRQGRVDSSLRTWPRIIVRWRDIVVSPLWRRILALWWRLLWWRLLRCLGCPLAWLTRRVHHNVDLVICSDPLGGGDRRGFLSLVPVI